MKLNIVPECLSPSALRKVSRRCHGRTNCSVLADTLTFGDPCFPGTRKHLRVSFTCGAWWTGCLMLIWFACVKAENKHSFCVQCPVIFWKMWVEGQWIPSWSQTTRTVRLILEILVFGCFWLACELSPLSPAGGWYTGPTYRPQNVLFTNCLEMIEKILGMWCQENPG